MIGIFFFLRFNFDYKFYCIFGKSEIIYIDLISDLVFFFWKFKFVLLCYNINGVEENV